MKSTFKHPLSDYTEHVWHVWPIVWCLLFGFFYFVVKGVWLHAIAGFGLALCTGGISWLVYPFFAESILDQPLRR